MLGKTFYQWLAVICYFIGVVANIGAWISLHTPAWYIFMIVTVVSWGVALGCVFFRPVRKSRDYDQE